MLFPIKQLKLNCWQFVEKEVIIFVDDYCSIYDS